MLQQQVRALQMRIDDSDVVRWKLLTMARQSTATNRNAYWQDYCICSRNAQPDSDAHPNICVGFHAGCRISGMSARIDSSRTKTVKRIGNILRQVVLYPGQDGYWVAECPSLIGCVSQGATRQDAIANIREAID